MRMHTGLVVAALGAAGLGPGSLLLGVARAEAQPQDDISAGTQLEAISDVRLHKAAIMRGSRVNVTKVVRQDGRIVTLDLELADGHVVPAVAVATVRASFKVVRGG